jgi:cell division protein FtsL
LLVIMPTNHKLLTTQREAVSSETQALLERWGRLHAVRTVLSLSATILMLSQFCPAG